jgi:ankyrin repeat protein
MSLLDQGADINSRDERTQTPLHLAATEGHLEVVCLLLERGAEVDSRNKSGWTPLHFASGEHVEISRVLVDHGANVNARQSNYWTAIHLSAYIGNLGVVRLLLGRGVDIHVLTDEGETPYQLSLRRGHQKIADLLREHGAGGA